MPRTPQEQMAMAPEVFKFTREFGRGQQIQEKPSVIQQIAGTLGNVALAGAGLAGAYGLARALGPETPSKGQIGTLNSATVDLNPDYSPPTVESGPEFDVQENIAPVSINPTYSSPTVEAGPEFSIQNTRPTVNLSSGYSPLSVDAGSEFYITEKDADTVLVEQPTDEIVVVDDSQPAITTTQQDSRSFLSDFAKGAINKAQEEVDAFDQGINWGQRFDQAASADSPLKGAAIVAGTVAEKGAKDIATRVGKDLDTAGNIVSEAVANVQKIPAAMQEVDNVIANEQMKASVMPDNKMQETTYLNPPIEGTGGVEIGIESDLSDTPQFDDTHQANEQASIAGLNRQTGLTTSSTTNLNPDLVRETARQLDGVPVSQDVKEAVAAEKLANPAQSVSYLLKSVLAGLTGGEQPTFPGRNPDEGLEDLIGSPTPAPERMQTMAGNEARMANVRSKYSMDYNPAAPKLPGDAIIGLNKDRFGSAAYIPTGGIDMLRDESVPASAYDVRVPREDEETPFWWEV